MSNDYSVVLVITKDDKSLRPEDRKDWYAVVHQGKFIDDCLYDSYADARDNANALGELKC